MSILGKEKGEAILKMTSSYTYTYITLKELAEPYSG